MSEEDLRNKLYDIRRLSVSAHQLDVICPQHGTAIEISSKLDGLVEEIASAFANLTSRLRAAELAALAKGGVPW